MSSGPPVAVADVAGRSVSFDALTSADGSLAWIETGTDGDGPAVVIWSAERQSTMVPAPVGSSLHAYGGGAMAFGEDGFWFVNADDGQVWRSGSDAPLTGDHRALGDLAFQDGHLLAVGENIRHDDLLMIDTGTGRIRVLHSAPFLASPRMLAGRVAWVQWADDAMPWDSSELWLASYQSEQGLIRSRLIAGGPGISVVEPRWGPGEDLFYMSDESGWWNLYRWNESTGPLAVASVEADCAAAPWEHGYRSYDFLPGGRIAMIAQNGPRHRLVVVNPDGQVQEVPSPYTSIKPYLATLGGDIALIGSSPAQPQQVAVLKPDGGTKQVVIAQSPATLEPEHLSLPQRLTVDSSGTQISVQYYPARTPKPVATIVRAHSGPTYQVDLRLDLEVQYLTSRGYAVADVDYRGSTGYGRAFRTALNAQWGVADVDDCAAVASYLIGSGRAQPGTLIIFGASAGGYTALRSSCDPATPFALAVARSPIVDPGTWQQTAPRFQRPHASILASKHPQIDPSAVRRPVAIVHGSKDLVAPICDTRLLVEALDELGAECRFLELPESGHFPGGRALIETLEFELAAFGEVHRQS